MLVVAVLASFGSTANALPCAVDQYVQSGACNNCAAGRTNPVPDDTSGSRTYCEGIAANYYGTIGDPTRYHSIVTPCPSASTSLASSVTTSLSACTCDSGYKATSTGCVICPTGTGRAATAAAGTPSSCGAILQGYYGTAGTDGTANSDATASPCPFAGSTLSSSALDVPLSACSPTCSAPTADNGAGSCECRANYYGTPMDSLGGTSLAASTGCTACPLGTTSPVASTVASDCVSLPSHSSPTPSTSVVSASAKAQQIFRKLCLLLGLFM